MRSTGLRLLLLFGVMIALPLTSASLCTIGIEGSLFDFSPLYNSNTFNVFVDPLGTGTLYWNACQPLPNSVQSCHQSDLFGTFISNDDVCTPITSNESFTSATFTLADSSDLSAGVTITYPKSPAGTLLNIKLTCDSNVSGFNQNGLVFLNNVYTLSVTSSGGCPTLDLSSFWRFLADHKWISTVAFLLIGFFLCFFGLKFLKFTISLASFVLGFVISLAVFDAVMDRDTSNTMNYVAFFVSLAVGAIFSFIAFKVEKAGFFALGALGGVTIALIASNIIQSEDKYVLWGLMGVCAFIFGTLCVYIKDYLIIFVSSLVGAYMLVKGTSFYIGGFPNEFTLSQEISNGDFSFPWNYYLYLSALIVLKIGGAVFQYKNRQKKKEEKKKRSNSDEDSLYERMNP